MKFILATFLFLLTAALACAQTTPSLPQNIGVPDTGWLSGKVSVVLQIAKTYALDAWNYVKGGIRTDRLPKFAGPVSQDLKNRTQPLLNGIGNAVVPAGLPTSSPELGVATDFFGKTVLFLGEWERYLFQLLH